MNGLTPDITAAEAVRHGVLRLTFADGLNGEVDVLDRMRGPVFEDARTQRASPKSKPTKRPEPSSGLAARISPPTRSTSASSRAPGHGPTRLPNCRGSGVPLHTDGEAGQATLTAPPRTNPGRGEGRVPALCTVEISEKQDAAVIDLLAAQPKFI